MLKLIQKAVNGFERFQKWMAYLAGACMVIMCVSAAYEAIARYVFHRPTTWAMELDMNLLLYFAFLAGGYVMLSDGHVRVDILYMRWSPRTKAIVDTITFLFAFIFIVVMVWKGWELASYSLEMGKRSAQALRWPLFPLQIMIPIGSAILGVQMFIHWVRDINLIVNRPKEDLHPRQTVQE